MKVLLSILLLIFFPRLASANDVMESENSIQKSIINNLENFTCSSLRTENSKIVFDKIAESIYRKNYISFRDLDQLLENINIEILSDITEAEVEAQYLRESRYDAHRIAMSAVLYECPENLLSVPDILSIYFQYHIEDTIKMERFDLAKDAKYLKEYFEEKRIFERGGQINTGYVNELKKIYPNL